MSAIPYILALVCGIALTVQIGANATVRGYFDNNAGAAAFASCLVGTLALGAYLVAARAAWPSRLDLHAVPGWAWTGGALGAFYVAGATIIGPRLGATAFLSLVILGQLIAALVIDHFGWIGFPQHALSATRGIGALLLVAGVVLATR
jgi:transporter family-2 protein